MSLPMQLNVNLSCTASFGIEQCLILPYNAAKWSWELQEEWVTSGGIFPFTSKMILNQLQTTLYLQFAKSGECISKVLMEPPTEKKNLTLRHCNTQNPFTCHKNNKQRTYKLSMTSPWRLAYGLFWSSTISVCRAMICSSRYPISSA